MKMKAPGHVNQHHGITGKAYSADNHGHVDADADDVKGMMEAGWQPVEEAPAEEPEAVEEAPAEPVAKADPAPQTTATDPAPALRDDGPTFEEYTKAGYAADTYPPQGWAAKESPGWTAYQAAQSK